MLPADNFLVYLISLLPILSFVFSCSQVPVTEQSSLLNYLGVAVESLL